jgi:hypothetical protein
VFIPGHSDGLFALAPHALGDFAVEIKDVSNVLSYQGLVAVKLPQDEPRSDGPVIYGMVRLEFAKDIKTHTFQVCYVRGALTPTPHPNPKLELT